MRCWTQSLTYSKCSINGSGDWYGPWEIPTIQEFTIPSPLFKASLSVTAYTTLQEVICLNTCGLKGNWVTFYESIKIFCEGMA